MVINPLRKFVFVEIPRTGTTSLRVELLRLHGSFEYGRARHHILETCRPELKTLYLERLQGLLGGCSKTAIVGLLESSCLFSIGVSRE